MWLPVTKSTAGTSRGVAVARPERVDAFERGGQRDHRAGRQRHADVAADGRRVPDLERRQAARRCTRGTAARRVHSGGPLNRCSSAIRQVAAISSPAGDAVSGGQPRALEIDQRVGGGLRLGEQPGAAGQPGMAVAPLPDLVE